MDEFHHDFSPWALLGRSWRIKSAPKHFWRPDFFTSHPGVPPSWCTALGVLLKGWTFDSHRKVKCRRPGLRAWHDFLVRRGNGWKGTSINGYRSFHIIPTVPTLNAPVRFSSIHLVGGLVAMFYFPIQLGISSSQLINIFQRGGPTTNQIFKCVFLIFFTWGFSGFPDLSLRLNFVRFPAANPELLQYFGSGVILWEAKKVQQSRGSLWWRPGASLEI